jgi:beta-glucosidase
VLLAWFPGQEAGNALADVLFGSVEPGGRLPVTWPAVEECLPGVQPVDGQLPYDEGLFIGYRWYEKVGRTPAFRFGHGLGYTDWEYLGMSTPQLTDDGDLTLTVRVRNVGVRPGREVVQVYASRPGSAVERAARWLAGFAVVDAAPGEEVDVPVTVPRRTLEHWDESAHAWTLEAGSFALEAGRSSGDLRVRGEVALP